MTRRPAFRSGTRFSRSSGLQAGFPDGGVGSALAERREGFLVYIQSVQRAPRDEDRSAELPEAGPSESGEASSLPNGLKRALSQPSHTLDPASAPGGTDRFD